MTQKNLTGKVALVTGASRGIGRAIALRLAQDGAAVVVNYVGQKAQAEQVVADIQKAGGKALAVQADVSQVKAIEKLFDATIQHFGKLDILVNNAGIILHKPLADTTEEEFDRIMGINAKGTFFACQQAARRMAEGGRIVNFSSTLTTLMMPNFSAYVASKGAIEQITHVLAKEMGPRKITVNCISPGTTDTELLGRGRTEEQNQTYARMTALGRLGKPEDIADVLAMLVGDDGHWITGQSIRVNGGIL